MRTPPGATAHGPDPRDAPVGLFDSGVGGTTVLRAIRGLLPGEDVLYLADQARAPYGPRPEAELRELALAAGRWLIGRGAKAVVVACNSASAAGLESLRAASPGVPFVGMVPAVKPAVQQTRSGVVGVLATPATLAGGLMREVVGRWGGGARVIGQPCPGLAEAVEAGRADEPGTTALLRSYVAPLLEAGADTLVLGCTHYPLLEAQLRAVAGPGVALVDPAPAVALQARRVLEARGALSGRAAGSVTYATTGDPAALARLLERLGAPRGDVVRADF